MANRRRTWGREARKALLSWTYWVIGCFLAMLATDLISEGPERITTEYLIARPVVFGVGWFGGVLVIRWWARRAADDPDKTDDGGSGPAAQGQGHSPTATDAPVPPTSAE